MKGTTLRDLHLNTSAIVKEVAAGKMFVILKHGVPVAELRPFGATPLQRRLPNRESLLAKFPKVKADSGRFLEEDRS